MQTKPKKIKVKYQEGRGMDQLSCFRRVVHHVNWSQEQGKFVVTQVPHYQLVWSPF